MPPKIRNIIYWITTGWLALGLFSTGTVQIIGIEEEVEMISHLGYPVYFLMIIGIWKILAAIAVLVPKFPVLKEWAYAGVFFNMSGAIVSHLVMSDSLAQVFPPSLILVLAVASWYLRPEGRKPVITGNFTRTA